MLKRWIFPASCGGRQELKPRSSAPNTRECIHCIGSSKTRWVSKIAQELLIFSGSRNGLASRCLKLWSASEDQPVLGFLTNQFEFFFTLGMQVSGYFEGQKSHTWEALESTQPCSLQQFWVGWFSLITSVWQQAQDEGKLDHNNIKWCFPTFPWAVTQLWKCWDTPGGCQRQRCTAAGWDHLGKQKSEGSDNLPSKYHMLTLSVSGKMWEVQWIEKTVRLLSDQ